jgi:hypothetical protein
MIGWKRSPHLPIRLRRWIDVVRAALHSWSWPYRKDLSVQPVLPPARRVRCLLPKLESLEAHAPTFGLRARGVVIA